MQARISFRYLLSFPWKPSCESTYRSPFGDFFFLEKMFFEVEERNDLMEAHAAVVEELVLVDPCAPRRIQPTYNSGNLALNDQNTGRVFSCKLIVNAPGSHDSRHRSQDCEWCCLSHVICVY